MLLLIFGGLNLNFAQGTKDSLLKLLKIAKEDTNKFKLYYKLSDEFLEKKDTIKSLECSNNALKLSTKINYDLGIARANLQIANLYMTKGALYADKSISHVLTALKIFEKLKANIYIGDCNYVMGINYYSLNNPEIAIEKLKKAISEYEKLNKKSFVAECYLLISIVYRDDHKLDEALSNANSALEIYKQKKDTFHFGSAHDLIGDIYTKKENYDKALFHHNESKNISELLSDYKGVADSYMRIGDIYDQQKKYDKTLDNYLFALKYYGQANDSQNLAWSYEEIGGIYSKFGKYNLSIENYKKVETILGKLNQLKINFGFYKGMSETYAKMNDFKNAYYYRALHSRLYDSVMDSYMKMKNKLENTQVDYQLEKSAKERELSEQLIAEKEDKIKQQRIINYSFVVGVIILSVFLFWIVNSRKKTRKQNTLIKEQKSLIEVKHKEISDSINYAKNIQAAFMPNEDIFYKLFEDAFIFFQPKDVISGDFYWFYTIHN
ncbi:MAG: hypothetical protein ACK452_02145, partial [Bacteroidota bacterium]